MNPINFNNLSAPHKTTEDISPIVNHMFKNGDENSLVKLANNCGFYYHEMPEVIISLFADLLKQREVPMTQGLATDYLARCVDYTIKKTNAVAASSPSYRKLRTFDGSNIVRTIQIATEENLNVRGQNVAPIEKEPGYVSKSIESTGLDTHPFQPNNILIVAPENSIPVMHRYANVLTPTLNTVAGNSLINFLQTAKPEKKTGLSRLFNS